MAVMAIQLNDELTCRLEKVARTLQQDTDGLILEAVEQFVERIETQHRVHGDTQDALEAVNRGEYCDGENVLAWMESWFSDSEMSEPKVETNFLQSSEHLNLCALQNHTEGSPG